MILSTGIDIVKIERLRNVIDKRGKRFLDRVFTNREIEYCSKKIHRYQHLAGRFASKEAISKALKLRWEKGVNWKDIEIINNGNGSIEARLSGQARDAANSLKIKDINLSMSHCQDYATAVAVLT